MDKMKGDKFQVKSIGPPLGIISACFALIGFYLAALSIPGYNIFDNMISELGVGPGGIFFNLGIILSGILAMPFYMQLAREFKEESLNDKVEKRAIVSAIISCIFYSLVGVFPAVESNLILFYLHGIVAAISLMSGMCYLILFSMLMLKSSSFSKVRGYHGFIVAGLYGLLLLTWIPIIEWSASFGILSWIIINSTFIIKSRAN